MSIKRTTHPNHPNELDSAEYVKDQTMDLMNKHNKDLEEEIMFNAMNICFDSLVRCVLIHINGKEMNWSQFKMSVDKYFPDSQMPEFLNMDKEIVTLLYEKHRQQLLNIVKHIKRGRTLAMQYYGDMTSNYTNKVLKLLKAIELRVLKTPQLEMLVDNATEDDAKVPLGMQMMNLVKRAHQGSTKKKSKSPLRQVKSKNKQTNKQVTRNNTSSDDESMIGDTEKENSEEILPRKPIEIPVAQVVQGLQSGRKRIAKNDPMDDIMGRGKKESRVNKMGGVEVEWSQTQAEEEEDESEIETDGESEKGKGPTPRKRGEEKFEAKKVNKKLSFHHQRKAKKKKASFVTTSSSPSSSPSKKKHRMTGRRRNRWTKIEEEYLIAGVEKYKSSWAKILDTYEFDDCRTNVNLKDKWRNLVAKNPALASKMD